MKKLNIIAATALYIVTCFPPTGGLWGACQNVVCTGDSVVLTLTGHNGTIQWQQSPDLITWSSVSGVTAANDTFGFTATNTYYYRAAVTDGDCLPFYSDTTLVTVVNAAPAAPTANAASNIAQASFSANWTSSDATVYYLDVATDAGFTSFVAGYNDLNMGNVSTYTVTGLSCNTTYYYRVRAANLCGTSGNSGTVDITTSALPPAAPTANAASNVAHTSFDANWTVSDGASNYYLDVSTLSSFVTFVTGYMNRNVGNVNSFSVTGLNCNITYYYRVRASSGTCGTSGNSGTINVITTASTLPTANAASDVAQSSFSANWIASSGATTYYLDIATDAGFTSFLASYNNRNVGNVTTESVSGLNCNTFIITGFV